MKKSKTGFFRGLVKGKGQAKTQGREQAIEWWNISRRSTANCNWCNKEMNPGEGYIVESGKLTSASSIVRAVVGVTSPDLIYENCLQKKMEGKMKNMEEDVVDKLITLYDNSLRGEGFITDSIQAKPVREIGQSLFDSGGKELMLTIHSMFKEKRPFVARNLEMVWDGIGTWRG